MIARLCLLVFLLFALFASVFAQPDNAAPVNLLRNGSFEGGTYYWHEVVWDNVRDKFLVKGNAAQGEYCLRIDKGFIQSAAFTLIPGKPVTISFSARADADATMGVQCSPCSREVGVSTGQTWGLRSTHPFSLGKTWKRYSLTFTPTAPQNGLWPLPTYMLQIGDADKPIFLDAITVAYDGGKGQYLPYHPIEAQIESPNLKGYTDVSGNVLPANAKVTLIGHAANPGTVPKNVTLRFQFFDYEGTKPLGPAIQRSVTLAPGQVASENVVLPLPAKGMVIARLSVITGGNILDTSDLPLTSLPYPKSATTPDYRERFGGSYFGPHSVALARRMGFTWARWYPHLNWDDHQSEGPDTWKWFDSQIAEVAKQGISMHAVLYGRPKWAFDGNSPLPKDMQWPENDPRWEDLSIKTAWDNFVGAAVTRYKGKPLVYEIENEPEFDWNGKDALYTKFTLRTARLIRQTDPKARIMVDNVYAIPSGINYHFLKNGGAKWIDIISWHDYHDGWLTDGLNLRRMRNALDDLGGKHIEIWFNEGWSYTNTAVDEPAVALTNHTSVSNTHAMVNSVAELTANGQDKTVLFHTGYEGHGMSFWDYCGPGTMLWDYYDYPLPLVAAWNTLAHHIGLSERVAFIRPPGANLCIFQDLRNGRGVIVAYADQEATKDAVISLPFSGLIAEDIMGNAVPLSTKTLRLSKTGRPVFLYSAAKIPGKTFAQKLSPLDRKQSEFVAASGKEFRLPAVWEGTTRGTAQNNPILVRGQPLWRIDQVWPDNPIFPANYTPLLWTGTEWIPEKNGFGGQPAVRIADGKFAVGVRGSWSGSEGQRLAGLVFIAPKTGTYKVRGTAYNDPWEGDAVLELGIFKKDTQRSLAIKTFPLPRRTEVLFTATVDLTTGQELVLLSQVPNWHNASNITLRDVVVTQQ